MYLGIDLGTSGVKSILMDGDQRILGEASSDPLAVIRSHRGWSEQDPDLWWNAVCLSLDRLKEARPQALAATRAIGLSGQMYGATLLGADDRPLRPAILWNDTRTAAECRLLEERVPELRSIVGRRPVPGVTAAKLLWVAAHEPEVFRAIRTVLLPKDHVRLRLCGEKVSDMADASGTMWVDLAARDWSLRMLEATGLTLAQMPRLVEGTAPTGRLRADLAARWGMAARPLIAGGGGDNACGACGAGVIGDGAGTVSLGTSGVLFVANSAPRPAGDAAIETLCHAIPGLWHQMSVVLSATSCLNWLAARLKRSARDLVAELGPDPRPASDLLFAPFLDGCWSPRNDPDIRGGFHRLAHQHGDAEMTHAVLQGVAFSLREGADAFRAAGTRLERLTALGGGSQSPLWLSILATVLRVDLDLPEASELGAAFGAARLALIADTGAAPADVLRPPRMRGEVRPAAAFAESYEDAFADWSRLTRAG